MITLHELKPDSTSLIAYHSSNRKARKVAAIITQEHNLFGMLDGDASKSENRASRSKE